MSPAYVTTHVDKASIAAWMPAGMLDWPGRLAATVFLSGCNLRCPFCHNPDLLTCAREPDAYDSFFEHLRSRRAWIDGVVVTGGEPTTDPVLFGLLEQLAALAVPVKLDTNGTRPDVLSQVLGRRLAEYVALDVKAAPDRYDSATGIRGVWAGVSQTIDMLAASGVRHEFRTTVYPDAVALEDLPRLAERLRRGERYVIQQFRPQRTLLPRAGAAEPYRHDDLLLAAKRCSTFLPTIVRGA